MNFITIFGCYVLSPYFASLVFPPQEAINCHAGKPIEWLSKGVKNCFGEETSSDEQIVDDSSTTRFETLENKYFEQKLDHYHFPETIKWKQRYLVYDRYYDGNGIVFIWIGTDKDIVPWRMQTGRWNEYAKQANALCIGIEHRGYGESVPNGFGFQYQGNVKDENLKYLSSEQALADVAWFIHSFRNLHTGHELPNELKWVVYGKGKQGALAVWLRMKFPHLVHASLSLSAPVLAVEDFSIYFKRIESDMLNVETDFKNKIQEAYDEIKNQLENKKFTKIGQLFKFCDKNLLENRKERGKNTDFMYFTFAKIVAALMQYGKDDLRIMKEKVTDIMLGKNGSYKNLKSIERFAQLIMTVSKISNEGCLQMDYLAAISAYKTLSERGYQTLHYPLPETLGERVYLYQSCNEFGQFETLDNFFGTNITLSFYSEFCHAVFEREYYPAGQLEKGVRRTNIFYGGLSIDVSRVIFVYGSDDPYRKLGIINRYPGSTVTHLLTDARHCYELDKLHDIPELNSVQDEIYHQLTEWLELSAENNKDI